MESRHTVEDQTPEKFDNAGYGICRGGDSAESRHPVEDWTPETFENAGNGSCRCETMLEENLCGKLKIETIPL